MVTTQAPGMAADARLRSAWDGRTASALRRGAAIGSARLAAGLVGIAHHQGTALPGMIAERVWPGSLRVLASQLGPKAVVIGTNGKTTTSALLSQILTSTGTRPVANRSGSNMRQGIMSSLVFEADLAGRLHGGDGEPRSAVFEVDELAFQSVLPDLGRTVIVATNLFRDQVDRYGETDAIVDRWAGTLAAAAPGCTLVYCADDPRLAMLAGSSSMPTFTFGLRGPVTGRGGAALDGDSIADPVACRTCGRPLVYRWRSIGHLGDFRCDAGHVARQRPDVLVEATTNDPSDLAGRLAAPVIRVSGRLGDAVVDPALPGLTGAYNVAAAVAGAAALGLSVRDSAAAVSGFSGAFGRLERLELEGRSVVLTLVKNTVSLAETVYLGPYLNADVVLLALNDAAADGRDVSWIWDAPIADLFADRSVVLAGSRVNDLQVRLKYEADRSVAGPVSLDSSDTLEAGLDRAIGLTPFGGTLLIAATYTAMMGLRTIAQHRGAVAPAPR